MATSLHAQNDGSKYCRVLYKRRSYHSDFRPVNSVQVAFCSQSCLKLSDTQSGERLTVVLGSNTIEKSIQKGTIPSATVTQQNLRETYRLKSSKTKNYKSHGCIQQSALWMDGIAAT